MAINKRDFYLLVAAIDFGTTYSGYAFSTITDFQRDPLKSYLKQWVDSTSGRIYNKTSTCILFDENKDFRKFGFEAETNYMNLVPKEKLKDWVFFSKIQNVSL